MKAAVLFGQNDLRILRIDEPEPTPCQVKIRNAFAGICGSDLHHYFAPSASESTMPVPHPLTGATPPQILGHEFSGTVVGVGEEVTGVRIGDRVAVNPVYSCGDCAACRRGARNTCLLIGFHGLNSHGGGMAEYTTVDAAMLHTLPPAVDLRLGALVEPMAVAWHAVKRSRIRTDESALIAGAGPIGIGLWFALKAHGVEKVIVTEPVASRRAVIEGLGGFTVDPLADDAPIRVASVAGSDGADVGFDAAGVGAAIESLLMHLAPQGRLVLVAVHERTLQLDAARLLRGEIEILGSLAYLPDDFDAVIDAMANGLYDTVGWVDEVALDAVVDAFELLRSGIGAKFLVANRGAEPT